MPWQKGKSRANHNRGKRAHGKRLENRGKRKIVKAIANAIPGVSETRSGIKIASGANHLSKAELYRRKVQYMPKSRRKSATKGWQTRHRKQGIRNIADGTVTLNEDVSRISSIREAGSGVIDVVRSRKYKNYGRHKNRKKGRNQ